MNLTEHLRYKKALGLLPYEEIDAVFPQPTMDWSDLRRGVAGFASQGLTDNYWADFRWNNAGGIAALTLLTLAPAFFGGDNAAGVADNTVAGFIPGVYNFEIDFSMVGTGSKTIDLVLLPVAAAATPGANVPLRGSGSNQGRMAMLWINGVTPVRQFHFRKFIPERWKLMVANIDALAAGDHVALTLGIDCVFPLEQVGGM